MLVSTVYVLHRILMCRFLKGFHFESFLQSLDQFHPLDLFLKESLISYAIPAD